MNIKNDYISFVIENKDLLEFLKKEAELTYDLIHPTILVLDYFVEQKMNIKDLTISEAESLFQIGFNYLYDSINLIKSIVNDNFDNDFNALKKYDENIYLLLRVDAMDSIFESQNEMISTVLDQLYNLIEKEIPVTNEIILNIEEILDKEMMNTEEVPTNDMFLDIAEELDLEII